MIVAVSVGSAQAAASLRRDADEVICLRTPVPFAAIGDWYGDFSQVADAEVTGLLGQALTCAGPRNATPDPAEVAADAGGVRLTGSLVIPPGAAGLVVFAHGSGGGWRSPRNELVAAGLNRAGLGKLLVDLLTPSEELSRANVFNVALLAARLTAITRWLRGQPGTAAIASVGQAKRPGSPVAGRASVFVFPDLDTGNTTYKAVQRSARVVSIGPMLQGLAKPVNDLSRGALVEDIIYTIALTAIQARAT